MSETTEHWICVSTARAFKVISEAELVLTAVGIETKLRRGVYNWRLYTRDEMSETARTQLRLYREENRALSIVRAPSPVIDNGIAGVAGYLSFIWLVWVLGFLGLASDIEKHGSMWVLAVESGEWWRLFTALLLHADMAHLVSNSIFGALFGVFAGRLYGSGVAWLLIVLCGAGGNFLNALIQTDMFRSLGASTATFAAAGLVGGLLWRRRFIAGRGWRYNFLPIAGVIACFAFLGVGGERTDVLGHFAGLISGLVVGMAVGAFDYRRLGNSGQCLAGAGAAGILMFAWLQT